MAREPPFITKERKIAIGASEERAASDDRVAVVVATRNRRSSVLRTLAHLTSLPERPRIVVVDNASSDDTAGAVRAQHPRVEVISLRQNLGAAARTVGVRSVHAPYVAFSDDDSWWAAGALARAADELDRHPRLALLAGRILVGDEEREDPTCTLMARSPLPRDDGLPGTAVLGFVACGAVVRRSAYLEAGGFHPRLLVYGEERLLAVDLAERGWHLAYVPEVVAHHHPAGARDARERERLEARNEVLFAWLRRPLARALTESASLARRALREPEYRPAMRDVVAACVTIARERKRVGRTVESELRLLERGER
ncbi:MAG: glycosyltransferase [Actinomycetota bacterium]|nr:glycosyltransferase [Actinomycetota bacterium]